MNSQEMVEKIYPQKLMFLIAFIIYIYSVMIPFLLAIWLVTRQAPDEFTFWSLPLFTLFLCLITYPYYTLSTDGIIINGATRWGWFWRREEIRLSEIDKEKVMSQILGQSLGIVIIYSTQGKKILTLGLSDSQISGILESARNQRQTNQSKVA